VTNDYNVRYWGIGNEPNLYTAHTTTSGLAEVWLFDIDHQAEQVSVQTISDGTEITLPAQSISLYVLP
jgi:hypothetical protein